jgi:hypothetical protein
MDTSSILLLVISSAISFGLGRTYVHFRDKKRTKEFEIRQAQVLRERPVEAESKNKSRRKRQLAKQRTNHSRY